MVTFSSQNKISTAFILLLIYEFEQEQSVLYKVRSTYNMDRSQNNIVSVAGSLIAAQHSQLNSGPDPVPCLLAECCWLIFTGGRNVADVGGVVW